MQRWFFLEDSENALLREGRNVAKFSSADTIKLKPKKWIFQVLVSEILPGETVCVTGSTEELGKWMPNKCVPLIQENNPDYWSIELSINDDENVEYRYCICWVVEVNEQVMVNRWESNLIPRIISRGTTQPTNFDADVFGEYGGIDKIEKGWLTGETVVQFKMFNNPLTLWRPRYASRTVYIKVTPVSLTRHNTERPTTLAEALEESLSTETQDTVEPPKHAHTVVASLTSPNCTFIHQGQFGKEYNPNDVLLYQTSVLELKHIAFLIDLYIYSSHAGSGDPPYHVGFSYLLPSALQSSEGRAILPVTSVKHRPLGQIELDYLVIKPMKNYNCDMRVSYSRHWKNSRLGLDVGHRGLGSSFKVETKNCSEVRENTIASLKTAASHGADFVEFDVQLSKDLIPVIYHDFHVCISMKKKKELVLSDMLELPVKDLNLEQLHFLKVYHLTEGKTRNPRFFDDDLEDHQAFPTLKQVLEVIDSHVGFNIEVKWGTQFADGTNELNNPIDINIYLDTILETVLQYGGERRVIFSCFNPDVCSMIRMKQNRYPVMFLTQGQTARYQHYNDPRCLTIKAAVQYAVCVDILGVNVHTEDLLRDKSQVRLAQEVGLVMFCWGDDNNDPATIRHLKELGLHGVIYDKIDQYSNKEVKESIFLVEARESQRQLLLVAAANNEKQPTSPKSIVSERSLDIEQARRGFVEMSTATSLESLETHNSDAEYAVVPQEKQGLSLDQCDWNEKKINCKTNQEYMEQMDNNLVIVFFYQYRES